MCVKVESASSEMMSAAVKWQEDGSCGNWNCECGLSQKSCCCAASQLETLEDSTFPGMMTIRHGLSELNDNIKDLTGTFTAPRGGVYVFSFTVYFNVDASSGETGGVRALQTGSQHDLEDSATQTVLLSLQTGSQVYMQLQRSCSICGDLNNLNTFSGYLLYPQ
ncbi:hypothetical protein AAFF_G00346110 [Aldrovandia affinis]|uniref:C1q domain-containing protein n=1 Tax=Aldrovandia affinis TaxID=143900 RepID=A0AAD7SK35_9TELE|nr:hypothetical protein AAFF_G00346110 [Aldrovandia affinis]